MVMIKFSKKYCSAYEAYRDGSTLYSIRNQVPTVNTNRTTFLTQARNDRSNSYAIYTYEIQSLYEDSGLTTLTTNEQWVKRITNNAAADLFCQEGRADSTTYFCDHYWTNAVEADRTLLLGACAGYGSIAGLFSLASNHNLGSANANVGTRLVYIP